MAARVVAQAEASARAEAAARAVHEPPPRLPPPLRSITPFSSSLNLKPEAPEELESGSELRTLTAKVLPLPPVPPAAPSVAAKIRVRKRDVQPRSNDYGI